MHKKTGIIFLLLLLSAVVLSGCWKKQVPIDKLSEDKSYHYKNQDLSFELVLPEEFGYYQTQRKEMPDYVDLEVLLPTSDREYPQEAAGYAKPIVVRAFNRDYYNNLSDGDEGKTAFKKLAENNKRVYAIKFWQTWPADWQGKWNNEMKEKIISGFKLD